MNINVAELLNGNYILLLFVVLALGLCLGKLRLGSIQLGNSIGVLVVSLLLGQQHFSINTDALNLGFMLFIFCVGVEAGPNFFSIFFRDGKNYLMLALVMVGSALVIALGLGKLFGWDIGLTAGMLAGSMTSTPVLVGAGDTLRHSGMESRQLSLALDNLSLGYALTYLIGLVSLIVGARYLPKLQHQDLQTSAQQIARERGLDTDANRKVYLPVIRAYRVGPELVAWTDGKNLRELGIYRQTGCYIERIRRNGILANPDGDAVLQMGDEIALVGYPDAHARLDPSFRNGKEVFDRDLLDMRIVTEEVVVKNHNAVGKRLAQLIFKPIDFQQTLNNFCPDIAFYSAAGVHISKGATCFNLEELPVKHWAMSMAQKHVLVVDHSKFGKVRPARMGDLKRFDIVVSDCCPEDEYVKYAQTQRIKLMY